MGLILFILIAVVAEIFTWIFVGNLVGSGWYVFFWFIAAFFIGLGMLRKSTQHIMPQMQQMQMGGMMGADTSGLGQHLPRAIAGLLLAIPGLLTDIVAVLMLLPPVQQAFKAIAMKALQKRQEAMMNQMMGGMMGGQAGGAQGNPFADMMRQMQEMQNQQAGGRGSQRDSTIIDGEAREVTPDAKRIDAPKNFKDVN